MCLAVQLMRGKPILIFSLNLLKVQRRMGLLQIDSDTRGLIIGMDFLSKLFPSILGMRFLPHKLTFGGS